MNKVEHPNVKNNLDTAYEVLAKISSNNTNQYDCLERQRVLHNLSSKESELLELMLRDYLNEYI